MNLTEKYRSEKRRAWVAFLAIIIGLLVVRIPVMYREPGEMDEEFYAIPGLMILSGGIPRMPYFPDRCKESVLYGADKIVFSIPPLSFYMQAIFYALLPAVYGTARMVSMASGMAILGMMWSISRRRLGGLATTVWAVGLFANSRWFFLQVIRARPDTLCAAFGVAAVWAIFQWRETRSTRWLWLAGIFIGLGGMTHPIALIYAIPIAGWVFIESRDWKRLTHPLLLAVTAILVASSWLLLIVQAPDIFFIQFGNQLMPGHHSDANSFFRLWNASWFHGGVLLHQMKAWHFFLALVPLVVCTFYGSKEIRIIARLGWAALLLIGLLMGVDHPVVGYFVFPSCMMFLCTGWLIEKSFQFLSRTQPQFRWTTLVLSGCLILSMIPTSRLGTLLIHLRNWNDENYNSPRFALKLMKEIPADAICGLDTEFLLDFVAAGRTVFLARREKIYTKSYLQPIEYLVGSRLAIENQLYQNLPGELIQTYGSLDNPYACYAEVRRPIKAATFSEEEAAAHVR